MDALTILKEVKHYINNEMMRTELTAETCETPSDFMLLGRVDLASELFAIINNMEKTVDPDEEKALEELEEELLNKVSGRFCINGNCEE